MKPKTRNKDFEFGTVGGEHTLAELNDLVAAHTYSINQTDQAATRLTQAQIQANPSAWANWVAEWAVLKARWTRVQQLTKTLNDHWFALPDNLVIVEPAYVQALQSIQQSYPELRTTKGDLVDLVGRLSRLGSPPDLSAMPQPRPSSDADLAAFKASDNITQGLEKAVKSAMPSNKVLAVAGASLLGALIVLRKLHLL